MTKAGHDCWLHKKISVWDEGKVMGGFVRMYRYTPWKNREHKVLYIY